jgi:cold shock CspA family protein
MSEIAIIKLFGNSRNERHSNYKILECEDGRRLDIHASEISCSEDELRRGRFITFEIEEKEAKKLRLLREVGVIDWYRSDKGFGCATLLRNEPDLWEMFEICQNGTAEVFVHINQVSSGSQELQRGDIVVCDIRKTYRKDKNKYRDDALNLKLLSEETDEAIIEGCAKSEDPRLWLPVFHKYLNTLQTTEEKVSLALEKINKQPSISEPRQVPGIRKEPFEVKFSLHIPHSLSTPSPQSFSDSLPDEILRFSPEIRRFLSLEKHLNVITVALMEDAKCNNLPQDLLLTELQSCLENLSQLNNEQGNKIRRQSIISQLPNWVKEIPSIRALLFGFTRVESRPDAPEAELIRAFIPKRGIFCLCHFTTIENLQGICREGGLLSIHQLVSRNSHYDQIDEVRVDGNLNHICCSINSFNEMYLYHAKQKSQCWVLLTIKPDYLWKQGTLFCPINAASQWGVHIKKGFAGLKSMYEPVVTDTKGRKYTREGLPDRKPTCIQAEVQVHESISLDDVLRIVVATPIDEQKVRDVGWKGEVTILPGLFK